MPCSAEYFEGNILNFTHTRNCNDFDIIGFPEKAQKEIFSEMSLEEHL